MLRAYFVLQLLNADKNHVIVGCTLFKDVIRPKTKHLIFVFLSCTVSLVIVCISEPGLRSMNDVTPPIRAVAVPLSSRFQI